MQSRGMLLEAQNVDFVNLKLQNIIRSKVAARLKISSLAWSLFSEHRNHMINIYNFNTVLRDIEH